MALSRQHEQHARSLADPEGFWGEVLEQVDLRWDRPPDAVLDRSRAPHFFTWFPGGKLNTCFNALDRHVMDGHGDREALIFESPLLGLKDSFTYAQLMDRVARFAGALADKAGVRKGDTVMIYMPMAVEAAIAALACARLGAVHSIVFGGFASHVLAHRIDDVKPKVVLSATAGIETEVKTVHYVPLLHEALSLASHRPERCVVLDRDIPGAPTIADKDPRRVLHTTPMEDWAEFEEGSQAHGCVSVESDHPLYVLYTSGTTAQPKGILRANGGHAVALKYSMPAVFDIHEGDVFWAAADIGWVVGYCLYGPLLNACTTVMYEGKPLVRGQPEHFRIIAESKVKTFFTAPTAIRAVRQHDPDGEQIKELMSQHEDCLENLFLAGERLDPATHQWAERTFPNARVVDHFWQTETAWPVAACCLGYNEPFDVKIGSSGPPVPGYGVEAVDPATGDLVPRGTPGDLVIRLPLPPGTLSTLYKNDELYVQKYLSSYPGYYETGDHGYIDEDDYVYIMSRTDDVINVAGHRLSTGALEEVLTSHEAVAEAVVVAVDDELKGSVPVGFVVRHHDSAGLGDAELKAQLVQLVRSHIGAVACYRQTHLVSALPKTRSGKVLRRSIREILQTGSTQPPPTIEDPAVLEHVSQVLKASDK